MFGFNYSFLCAWISQRKPEEESGSSGAQDTEVPVKKARQEEEPPKPVPTVTENGHDPSGNGTASSEQKWNVIILV